jgi:hypothetical protein
MQEIIVYLIVAAAALYLVRMVWSALVGGKSSCNSCGSNCGSQSKSAPAAPKLVQIDLGNLNGKR